MSASPIAPGAHILARDAVWRVLRVDPTSTGNPAWTVIGVSGIVRDQEAIFLQDYEPDVVVLDPKATALADDTSPGHRAGLVYLEALLRDVPPADDQICVGHQAAMDVLPFQLEPARLALRQLRARILIADAVGLGKTLEAGILLSELIRRGRARRILVVTTKSMLTQFQKEMWSRFTIPLVRLDSAGLQRIREHIPTNHNPFHHFDRTIISVDTLKQKNALRHHLEKARWDVIVIDEAHNVAERGQGSLRAQLAQSLASRSDTLILLSATPHDGRAESFASLMNMLDPTAIANPRAYAADDIRGLYVRRFKRDVADELRTHFPDRQMHIARAATTPAEDAAFQAIGALRLSSDRAARGSVLFRTSLLKAMLSSPAACLQTLSTRLKNLRTSRQPDPDDLAALEHVVARVKAVDLAAFSRYHRLLRLLTHEMGWTRKKDDRVVVFTERIETLKLLHEHLPPALGLEDKAVEILHGGMSDIDQQRVVEAFGKDNDPVRLLIASDVASEGLNLHYLCHRMVHFDVPWSLMVFQQRNGRIDRYGQERAPQILYLGVESALPSLQGDQRILDRLIEKEHEAHTNIGDPRNLVGVHDIEAQEETTALALQDGLTPEAFDARLGLSDVDPLELLLGLGALPAPAAPPDPVPSLFPSDRTWLMRALEQLRETAGLEFRASKDGVAVEVRMPPELSRRFRRLPPEIKPPDGWLVLTDDRDVMQAEMKAARAQEDAWPRVQLLWPLHPVLSWVADRMRGQFGRHTAPVLCVGALPPDAACFIVSGLVPNRQGQPLVHRWYVASYEGGQAPRLETFEGWLGRTGFGRAPHANLNPVDLPRLGALLPDAVRLVEKQVRSDRDALNADLQQRLSAHRSRLSLLRERQNQQLELDFSTRRADLEAMGREQRKIQRIFDDTERWAKDALTTEPTPFLQVLSVICGPGWRQTAGGGA